MFWPCFLSLRILRGVRAGHGIVPRQSWVNRLPKDVFTAWRSVQPLVAQKTGLLWLIPSEHLIKGLKALLLTSPTPHYTSWSAEVFKLETLKNSGSLVSISLGLLPDLLHRNSGWWPRDLHVNFTAAGAGGLQSCKAWFQLCEIVGKLPALSAPSFSYL